MGNTRHIQTELDEEIHNQLKIISRYKNKSLKSIVRDAIVDYIKQNLQEIENDSFFGLIGSFETEEGNWSERDDWREWYLVTTSIATRIAPRYDNLLRISLGKYDNLDKTWKCAQQTADELQAQYQEWSFLR